MTAPDRQRDGGVFTTGAICPHCGTCDIHLIREPNPAVPYLVRASDGEREQIVLFGGRAVREYVARPDLYDRWDERGFEVVRTCTSCGWEWGQR